MQIHDRRGFASTDLLIHTIRLHHRIVEKRIDGLGIHHSQHRMLMYLAAKDKMPSQREIADALDISPACVAQTLKTLGASGFIEKNEGMQDGRCKEVVVTAAGREIVNSSKVLFESINEEMYRNLSDGDLETLNTLLTRIFNNMTEMEDTLERSV